MRSKKMKAKKKAPKKRAARRRSTVIESLRPAVRPESFHTIFEVPEVMQLTDRSPIPMDLVPAPLRPPAASEIFPGGTHTGHTHIIEEIATPLPDFGKPHKPGLSAIWFPDLTPNPTPHLRSNYTRTVKR